MVWMLLRLAVIFFVSAIAGSAVVFGVAFGAGIVQGAVYTRTRPSFGAVAGGITEVAVLFVHILCGIIGVLLARLRMRDSRS
jgi:hypothetical protein